MSTEHEDEIQAVKVKWEAVDLPRLITLKQRVIALLEERGYDKPAKLMKPCGVRVNIAAPNGQIESYAPTRHICGSLWCPVCATFKAFQHRQFLRKKVLYNTPPGLTWLHVTSTVQNCTPADLRASAQAVTTGTNRLLKYSALKGQILGSYTCFEYKHAKDDSQTNPHCHSLVAFRKMNSWDLVYTNQWDNLWPQLKVCGLLARDVHVRELYSQDKAKDIARYITKDADADDWTSTYDDDDDDYTSTIASTTREGILTRWTKRLADPSRFETEVLATSGRGLKKVFGNLVRPRAFPARQSWRPPWATS